MAELEQEAEVDAELAPGAAVSATEADQESEGDKPAELS